MLHLASKSPRRRELLAQLGLEFGLLDVDVPEQREPGEPPAAYVSRVAREKAGAGLLAVVANKDAVVLGADTEVVLGDRVFGKPADADDAARMLRDLSGRSHRVVSSVWLVSAGREAHATCVSEVRVEPLDDAHAHSIDLSRYGAGFIRAREADCRCHQLTLDNRVQDLGDTSLRCHDARAQLLRSLCFLGQRLGQLCCDVFSTSRNHLNCIDQLFRCSVFGQIA